MHLNNFANAAGLWTKGHIQGSTWIPLRRKFWVGRTIAERKSFRTGRSHNEDKSSPKVMMDSTPRELIIRLAAQNCLTHNNNNSQLARTAAGERGPLIFLECRLRIKIQCLAWNVRSRSAKMMETERLQCTLECIFYLNNGFFSSILAHQKMTADPSYPPPAPPRPPPPPPARRLFWERMALTWLPLLPEPPKPLPPPKPPLPPPPSQGKNLLGNLYCKAMKILDWKTFNLPEYPPSPPLQTSFCTCLGTCLTTSLQSCWGTCLQSSYGT